MAEWLKLLAYALPSRFKSRARLEAENLVLRQQINILVRRLPKRVRLTNSERLRLVWLYRVSPSILNAIGGHQTRNADPLAPPRLSCVLAVEISSARRTATA